MKYDVIVVGGGPAGIITAVTARKYYSIKKILVIKSIGNGIVPCAIPYMFSTLKKPEDNVLENEALEKNSVKIIIDKVTEINRKTKNIHTKNNKTFNYEKLVLATGSKSIMFPIKGNEKKGIYCIQKEMNYLKNLKKEVYKAKNIVVIGAGFIGVEFADELSKLKNAKISIMDIKPEILSNSFDFEFSELAKAKLIEKKVNVITNLRIEKFIGNKKIESVLLSNKKVIPADLVIIGIGTIPNSELAEKTGLEIGKSNGILVDEYLRTSDSNIFAVGDCAEKKDFFTRKKINVMLASTATAEARIAGANLFKLKVVRENKGTIASYSTQVGDLVLGSAGLTEKTALKEGFEIIIGRSECIDKHPKAMSNSSKLKVKLIFWKQSGTLLGGQVAGGQSAGEITNIIGLAIQKTMSLTELETLQIATHPKLTSAPTAYPIILAAQDAIKQDNKS